MALRNPNQYNPDDLRGKNFRSTAAQRLIPATNYRKLDHGHGRRRSVARAPPLEGEEAKEAEAALAWKRGDQRSVEEIILLHTVLKDVPLLKPPLLPPPGISLKTQWSVLHHLARTESYEKGDPIVLQGEFSETVYVVWRGRVRVKTGAGKALRGGRSFRKTGSFAGAAGTPLSRSTTLPSNMFDQHVKEEWEERRAAKRAVASGEIASAEAARRRIAEGIKKYLGLKGALGFIGDSYAHNQTLGFGAVIGDHALLRARGYGPRASPKSYHAFDSNTVLLGIDRTTYENIVHDPAAKLAREMARSPSPTQKQQQGDPDSPDRHATLESKGEFHRSGASPNGKGGGGPERKTSVFKGLMDHASAMRAAMKEHSLAGMGPCDKQSYTTHTPQQYSSSVFWFTMFARDR